MAAHARNASAVRRHLARESRTGTRSARSSRRTSRWEQLRQGLGDGARGRSSSRTSTGSSSSARARAAMPPADPPSASSSPSTARRGTGSARRGARPVAAAVERRPPSRQPFGDVDLVVPEASSTAEVLRDVFAELGVALTPEIAEAALCRARNGTGGFQVLEHDAEGVHLARKLVGGGCRFAPHLRGRLRNGAVHKAKLLARALERMEIYEGGRVAVVTSLLKKHLAEVGAAGASTPREMDRPPPGRSRAPSSRSWMDKPPGPGRGLHRISLRSSIGTSSRIVSKIASASGGGGHREAAGFSSDESNRRDHRVRAARSLAAHTRRPGRLGGPPWCTRTRARGVGASWTSRQARAVLRGRLARCARRTGARTGHAAASIRSHTGHFVLLLSGKATQNHRIIRRTRQALPSGRKST